MCIVTRRRGTNGDQKSHKSTLLTNVGTNTGEALRPAFDEISRRFVPFLYAGLSREESDTLERLLGKVLDGQSTNTNSQEQTP